MRATWDEARSIAHAAAAALPPEVLALDDALGRKLAAPLWALAPLPAADTSAMDGWAVRGPGPWRVRGRTLAGEPPPAPLQDGEAHEVATGAVVPDACDGVVPVEAGVLLDDELTAEPPLGRHVRRTGEECAARTAVLPAGALLRPATLGFAAALGHDVLEVRPLPTVAALVTGDELLALGLPSDGKVRDAVGPMLSGAVAALGGRLVGLDRVGDTRAELLAALARARAEVVLTSGASSSGPADHLAGALRELDAELLVEGVQVRPGSPQLLARLPDGRLLAGLPGNPLAALATLVTLVAPALAGLSGAPAAPARLCAPHRGGPQHRPAARAGPARRRAGAADGRGGRGDAAGRGGRRRLRRPDRQHGGGDRVRTVPLP